MKIVIQTGSPTRGPARSSATPWWLTALASLWVAASASAQTGQILCSVTENGSPARGNVVVEQKGRQMAAGSCNGTLSVPAGKYEVTVRIDGVLDNPAKTRRVEVATDKTVPVSVDFKTGVLEVRIESQDHRGTGIVTVSQLGKRIGTLGSGVATHLSAGRYEVLVRLDGKERRYSVDLKPGQRRLVRAQL